MERPKGYRDTFSRPHLVKENERAQQTISQITEVIQANQAQTVLVQQQLASMRTDGKSSLSDQSKVIERITRNNRKTEEMGLQIGKLQDLIEFNRACIGYIDWLKGEVHGHHH